MKTPICKRALALLMALAALSLPACSTVDLLESDRTASTLTAPTQLTEAPLTTPSYYTPEAADPNDPYTPEKQLALLADRDFGGAYFLVVQEKGLENAIFPTSDELVSVYADRRNRLVQEKYNVQLASNSMTAEEIITELTEKVKNNVYFCDLLVVSPTLLQQLQEKDLLVTLDSLPFFETDSVCISADATAELNADFDGIYGIWGDVLRQPTRQLCIYFNETMAESLSAPNFYAVAQDGNWDFNTLLTYAERAAALDSVGGVLYDGSAADLLLAATGISSASEEGEALLADPAYLAMIDRLNSLILPPVEESVEPAEEGENSEDGEEALPEEGDEETPVPPTDALGRFLAGQSLFYIGTLGEISSFAQTDDCFGVLPIPKFNSSDSAYPTLTDQSNLPVLACPMNVASAEGTGIMLSALNAASCDEINDIFLQSAEQYVRTNGSFLMLPYLLGSPNFDRKLIYG